METQDIFVAYPQTEEEISKLRAIMKDLKIKFEISKEILYTDFVDKILESRQQVNGKKKKKLSDIWKE